MDNVTPDDKYFIFTRLTVITPHEAALAMCGFDYEINKEELSAEQLKKVLKLRSAITRNLQSIDKYKNNNSTTKVDADIVLTASYIFLQDGCTPLEVKDRIFSALQQQVKNKYWEENLRLLGGNELYEAGKKLRHNGRGQYRKEDEDNNSWKLISLLVELLERHGKNNYGDLSVIYNDIIALCDEKNISHEGIKRATFYKKIKFARDILKNSN